MSGPFERKRSCWRASSGSRGGSAFWPPSQKPEPDLAARLSAQDQAARYAEQELAKGLLPSVIIANRPPTMRRRDLAHALDRLLQLPQPDRT